jgi:hypothetical protein
MNMTKAMGRGGTAQFKRCKANPEIRATKKINIATNANRKSEHFALHPKAEMKAPSSILLTKQLTQ